MAAARGVADVCVAAFGAVLDIGAALDIRVAEAGTATRRGVVGRAVGVEGEVA